VSDVSQASSSHEWVVLGRVTSAYGLQGWVKVYSYTDPVEQILAYSHWFLRHEQSSKSDSAVWFSVDIAKGKRQGKVLLVRFEGCGDRNQAERYLGHDIAVKPSDLPVLEDGEYYHRDLHGLTVETLSGQCLGRISSIMETGANDVLVVKGKEHERSVDQRERLIPYLLDSVVKRIDLAEQRMQVDWDPEF